MRTQKITVNTKGGLIAALECAKDYLGPTDIRLNRKHGVTFYKLRPNTSGYKTYADDYIKGLNTMRKRLRRMKAKDLLGG